MEARKQVGKAGSSCFQFPSVLDLWEGKGAQLNVMGAQLREWDSDKDENFYGLHT